MIARIPCRHGRYERHNLGDLSFELIEPEYIKVRKDGDYGWHCHCPGGLDIRVEDYTVVSKVHQG